MNKAIFIVLLVLILNSCHIIFVKSDMKKMYGRVVLLPTDMQCVRGTDSVYSIKGTGFRYVKYVDSMACSPCQIHRFPDYFNFAIQYGDTLKVVFIIAPGVRDAFTLPNLIRSNHFPFDVYIDYGHQFEAINRFIPKTEYLHSFLLDGNGKICLIGDYVFVPELRTLCENRIRYGDAYDSGN